jgi:hypothetical protein
VSAALRINLACALALLGLQVAWHGLVRWPGGNVGLLVLLGVPVAATVLLHLLRRPSARFWTGVVALLTFCHGVTEAWTIAGARWPGLAEAALSAAAVTSASWDGMHARFAARRRTPPNV